MPKKLWSIFTDDIDTCVYTESKWIKERDVLEKLIESGRGDYAVMTEAYCCGTNGVELWDRKKLIDNVNEVYEKNEIQIKR